MSNPFAAIETAVNTACIGVCANAVVVIGASTIYATFDDHYATTFDVSASGPALIALSSTVATVAYGTALSVDGVAYTVTAIEPDGTGVTVLRLQEA